MSYLISKCNEHSSFYEGSLTNLLLKKPDKCRLFDIFSNFLNFPDISKNIISLSFMKIGRLIFEFVCYKHTNIFFLCKFEQTSLIGLFYFILIIYILVRKVKKVLIFFKFKFIFVGQMATLVYFYYFSQYTVDKSSVSKIMLKVCSSISSLN